MEKFMKNLRIATFNVEWMVNLFDGNKPQLRTKQVKAMGRVPVNPKTVAERIAGVLTDLDAHIVGIQEGPRLLEQMQFFADEFLGGRYTAAGVGADSQNIFTLVRKDCPVKAESYKADHKYYDRLLRSIEFQPWGEVNKPMKYKMARPPALLRLSSTKNKQEPVHLVVAHTKSQFTKGFTRAKFDARDSSAMQDAIRARQKLSADIAALRRHVTNVILERRNAAGAIVLGDLNDGFTRSIFETEFLQQSLVDELRGSFRRQSALLDHVLSESQLRDEEAFTVEFRSPEKRGLTRELIDHILVTPAMRDKGFWLKVKSGQIAHDAWKAHVAGTGAKPDDRPSDHIPVIADFSVS